MEVIRLYWDGTPGKRMLRKYLTNKGEYHRKNGPAVTEWYRDGRTRIEGYYTKGVYNRTDNPAYQEWYDNGNLKRNLSS